MDMYSRNQYLKELRKEYLKARTRKKQSLLLDEAEKRTRLNRKYLIDKLKPGSNLDKDKQQRKKRRQYYDNSLKPALVKIWQIFDYPCGQRLKTLIRSETDRLRLMEELRCSDEIALKLKQMSSATIDRKLRRQKESQRIKGRHKRQLHPLLYQKIPIKVFPEQDRTVLGNIQIDLVEHCGSSAQGEFINTFSSTDISTGWWEGEAQMGRAQERSFESVSQTRSRYPCLWKEMHSDNDTTFINEQLFKYAEREGLGFSRSRPYKKDDNCLVEQKNWTHVKKFVGYLRYDTNEELDVLNSLYQNELRLYKNFFQPVIKLRLKERINGRIRRRYDKAKTPYQRMLESREITQEKKQELKTVYQSLNPAQLKRVIDWKLNLLYRVYQKKNKTLKVEPMKRLKPISASFLNLWPKIVSVR